jgi:hypothetical protein
MVENPFNPILEYEIYRTARGTIFPEDSLAAVPSGELSFLDEGPPEGAYDYVVTASYAPGESGPSNLVEVEMPALASVGPGAGDPREPLLSASPNPLPGHGTLHYTVPDPVPAQLTIVDVAGRLVTSVEIPGGSSPSGQLVWNGRDSAGRALPSGVYLATLSQGSARVRSRLVLVR